MNQPPTASLGRERIPEIHGPPPISAPIPASATAGSEVTTWTPDDFALLFDLHAPAIHRYIARRLGTGEADDLVGQTFLIAFESRDRFEGSSSGALPWLYGIATNLIRRHRRDEVRAWRAAAKLPLPVPAATHEDRVAAQVTAEGASPELAAALAKLNAKDREVLLLVALGQLTYDEVAAALGSAYGTVCSRLSRARRVVRAAVTNPTEDPA